jgi:hypothetical protein
LRFSAAFPAAALDGNNLARNCGARVIPTFLHGLKLSSKSAACGLQPPPPKEEASWHESQRYMEERREKGGTRKPKTHMQNRHVGTRRKEESGHSIEREPTLRLPAPAGKRREGWATLKFRRAEVVAVASEIQ